MNYSKEKDDDLIYFQSYEKNLLQALYGYIRGGRFDDAVELCRKAHQPWRAASIRGSFLFQWRALCEFQLLLSLAQRKYIVTATEPRDEDSMEDEDDMDIWSGNQNRRLWKTACTRAALSVRLFSKSYIV